MIDLGELIKDLEGLGAKLRGIEGGFENGVMLVVQQTETMVGLGQTGVVLGGQGEEFRLVTTGSHG